MKGHNRWMKRGKKKQRRKGSQTTSKRIPCFDWSHVQNSSWQLFWIFWLIRYILLANTFPFPPNCFGRRKDVVFHSFPNYFDIFFPQVLVLEVLSPSKTPAIPLTQILPSWYSSSSLFLRTVSTFPKRCLYGSFCCFPTPPSLAAESANWPKSVHTEAKLLRSVQEGWESLWWRWDYSFSAGQHGLRSLSASH